MALGGFTPTQRLAMAAFSFCRLWKTGALPTHRERAQKYGVVMSMSRRANA